MIKTIIVDDDELCISVIEDMIDQLEEIIESESKSV